MYLKTKDEEKTIISCLLNGETLKQIANKLNLAKSSIQYRTQKIFKKYEVEDRYELAMKIYKNNLSKLIAEVQRLQVENENLKSTGR